MVAAVRTDTDDFIPVDGDGEGYLWHATLHLCDPWTKVRLAVIWHRVFESKERAAEDLSEGMCSLSGWSVGCIAPAPVCWICRSN